MYERLYVAVKFSHDGNAVCAFTVSSISEFERWKGKDPDLYWALYSVKHFNLNKVEVKQTSIFDVYEG